MTRKQAAHILGVFESVDPAKLKERYKELVKQHHPDRSGIDHSSEDWFKVNKKFAEIKQAFAVLSNQRRSETLKIRVKKPKKTRPRHPVRILYPNDWTTTIGLNILNKVPAKRIFEWRTFNPLFSGFQLILLLFLLLIGLSSLAYPANMVTAIIVIPLTFLVARNILSNVKAKLPLGVHITRAEVILSEPKRWVIIPVPEIKRLQFRRSNRPSWLFHGVMWWSLAGTSSIITETSSARIVSELGDEHLLGLMSQVVKDAKKEWQGRADWHQAQREWSAVEKS